MNFLRECRQFALDCKTVYEQIKSERALQKDWDKIIALGKESPKRVHMDCYGILQHYDADEDTIAQWLVGHGDYARCRIEQGEYASKIFIAGVVFRTEIYNILDGEERVVVNQANGLRRITIYHYLCRYEGPATPDPSDLECVVRSVSVKR